LEKISTLRRRIDRIDDEILRLLNKRVKTSKSIFLVKQEIAAPAKDYERESEVYLRVVRKASEFGLNPEEIKSIYKRIIAMCVRAEKSVGKTMRQDLVLS
jgi:chorismate mutase